MQLEIHSLEYNREHGSWTAKVAVVNGDGTVLFALTEYLFNCGKDAENGQLQATDGPKATKLMLKNAKTRLLKVAELI